MPRTSLSAILMAILLICLIGVVGVSMCQLTKQAQGCKGEPGVIISLKYKGTHFLCKLPMDITIDQLNHIATTPSVLTYPLGGKLHLIEYGDIGIYILEIWNNSELTVTPVLVALVNVFTQEMKFWEIEECKCKRLKLKTISFTRFWKKIHDYQWEDK